MNKKCIGLLLAIPALMGFGLTSCSNEDPMFSKEESATKQVEVSLIAELGNLSRASLTFDESKNLKFKWANEDVIYAVNADNGKYLGKLTVAKVLDDPRNCEFKGTLNLPTLGSANLKFYYLGEKGKMEFDSETYLPKDIEVDFSSQTGTAAELDDYDLLKAEKEYQSTDNGKLGRLSFVRHFSTGQFVLKYNGEELDLNGKTVNISAASGTLYNKASLNYMSGEYSHYEGLVNVTPSTNNFYINIIPTENVQFKFTVDMGDGNVFEGEKGGKIEEDTYYSDNLDAIVVEMKHSDGRDDTKTYKLFYDQNFRGENDVVLYSQAVTTELSCSFPVSSYEGLQYNESKPGYQFVGWNTAEDGSGKDYLPNHETKGTFELAYNPDEEGITSATLYAQWKEVYNYKITLKYDDGTTKEYSESTTEESYTVTLPDVDEFAFHGWRIEGVTSYKDDSKTTWTVTKENPEVTLVRAYNWQFVWIDDPADGVGAGEYGKANEYGPTPHKLLSAFPTDNSNSTMYQKNVKEGYTFLNWVYEGAKVTTNSTILAYKEKTVEATDKYGTQFLQVKIYAKWKKDSSSGNIIAPGANGSDY